MTEKLPSDVAKNWRDYECTLNGRLAKITGWKEKFATIVAPLDDLSGVWSWEAVNRIMTNGGDFKL